MPVQQQEEGVVFSIQTDRQVYIFGKFRLDVQDCRLWHCDISISLPPKTFDILHVLIQNAGQLIEKKTLLHAVWPTTFVEEGNLSVHISALRKIFNRESPECEFIETVPRRGYRFTAPVTKLISGNSPLSDITDSGEALPQSDAVVLQNPPSGPHSTRTLNVLARVSWGVLAATLVATVCIVATTRIIRNRHQRPGLVHATSDSRPLTSEPGVYSWPTFSPDGSRLAYSWRSDTGQIRNIYIQSIGSDSREKLGNNGQEDFSPAWSPTGQEIAFLHTTNDPKWLEVKIAEVRTPHTERHLALIDNIKSSATRHSSTSAI